mmetsp:Transcript_76332/g.196555  ORF Transcript_76332/g.196555 Transcript_76332/m.196555 type:complete len:213 (+) Transcript_76332:1560-2198(+)
MSMRRSQKTAKRAPIVRWYSSCAVRPELVPGIEWAACILSSPGDSAWTQYSFNSGKAAVMSSKKCLQLYDGSRTRFAAWRPRPQSVLAPFISACKAATGEESDRLLCWSCRGSGEGIRRFSTSSSERYETWVLLAPSPSSSGPSDTLRTDRALRCSRACCCISRSSTNFQHQCVMTTSSVSGPFRASRRANVKSVPAGSPMNCHWPLGWLRT